MNGSQRQEKPLPVAEALPPGCPPQPPVKHMDSLQSSTWTASRQAHGQSLVKYMDRFQIHGTKLQVSQATCTIMETTQLKFQATRYL